MSKRDQGALIEEYQKRGYLPAAVVNFITLLGWNPGGDREKMPIEEIVALFDLPAVNQSNARFDDKKMAHMNMLYLLALPAAEFAARARAFFRGLPQVAGAAALAADADYFQSVMALAQPKIKGFEELAAYTAYFWADEYPTDEKAKAKALAKGEPKARLAELVELVRASGTDFSSDVSLEAAIKALAEARGLGFGDYQGVARVAVTGLAAGPSITSVIRLIGRERVATRLDRFAAGLV
jgi:glutamyl-tRNA synthetase